MLSPMPRMSRYPLRGRLHQLSPTGRRYFWRVYWVRRRAGVSEDAEAAPADAAPADAAPAVVFSAEVDDVRTFYGSTLLYAGGRHINSRYLRKPYLYDTGERTPSSAMMCGGYEDTKTPNYVTNGIMVTPAEKTPVVTLPGHFDDHDEFKSSLPLYCQRPLLQDWQTCPLHLALFPNGCPKDHLFTAITRARMWANIWNAEHTGYKDAMNPAKWRWNTTNFDAPWMKSILVRAGAHYPLSKQDRDRAAEVARQATMFNKKLDEGRSSMRRTLYENLMVAKEAHDKNPNDLGLFWDKNAAVKKWKRFQREHRGNLSIIILPAKWPMLKDNETTPAHLKMFGPEGQPTRDLFKGFAREVRYLIAKAITKARLWDALREHHGHFSNTHPWWEEILYVAAGTAENSEDFGFSAAMFGRTMRQMQAIAKNFAFEYDQDKPTLLRAHNAIVSKASASSAMKRRRGGQDQRPKKRARRVRFV